MASLLALSVPPRVLIITLSPWVLVTPIASIYAWTTGYAPSLVTLQILREATIEELQTYAIPLIICACACIGLVILYRLTYNSLIIGRLRMPLGLRLAVLCLTTALLTKDLFIGGIYGGGKILLSRLERMQPCAPALLIYRQITDTYTLPDRAAMLSDFSAAQNPISKHAEICVLVIGESARRSAHGLYNPTLDTNPLLSRRDLIVFEDALACGTATIQSVPVLLTGAWPGDGEWLPFHKLGLIEAFRLSGFRTAWISTQQADGEISSYITAFSVNAHERYFLNGRLEVSASKADNLRTDGISLEQLKKVIQRTPDKIFIIVHLLGSHLPYPKRYPPEFTKWPVEAKAEASMWRWIPPFNSYQRTELTNAYYNSVCYTDWVLDQMISILQETTRPATLTYMSDHGETTADAPLRPANHGILAADVVEVPLFIWASDSFMRSRPHAFAALQKNRQKTVSALDVAPTLMALYDIIPSKRETVGSSLTQLNYSPQERKVMLLDTEIVRASTPEAAPIARTR